MRPSSAELALARRSLRQVVAGATIVGLTFGGTAASSALAYATTFTTVAEREQIASTTAGDRGLTILMGPVSGIGTIGGYTVYKGFVFLTTIGAIWAVLALTASHLVSFIFNFIIKGEYRRTVVPQLMFAPYGRIVVLHIAILGGAFAIQALGSPIVLLIILIIGKIAIDLGLHFRSHRKLATS